MHNICIMGLGYIGLPTASLLATKGHKVHGVDKKEDVVEAINNGNTNIYEPDLDVFLKAAVQSGNLTASCQAEAADIYIITVPTPFKGGNHEPDMSFLEEATKEIATLLKPEDLVIIESTSPVGTTEEVGKILSELRPDLNIPKRSIYNIPTLLEKDRIYLAYSPERVLPGLVLKELVENNRIVGGIDRSSAEKAANFYGEFVTGKIKITDSRTAELCKLTENAFRDVNIAFANELSFICDDLDINVWELIELANYHPRVNILQPGPGVGGHCIAVDPWFIVHSVPDKAKLILSARNINDKKPHYVLEKIKCKAQRIKEPVIACLGLSFKADIDDLRESPALFIVQELAEENVGSLLVVEPNINQIPESLRNFNNVELVDMETAILKADMVIVLVEHKQFLDVDIEFLKEKIIIDTRGIWR